jgi:hypothetical protein
MGVNISNIDPDAEYRVEELAKIFKLSVQSIRRAIKNEELKARRKGKFLLIRGRDAVNWWNAE